MSGRAVLYLRVSSVRQLDGTSIPEQERVCAKWCEAAGLEIDRVFVEQGESAKTTKRTEFQRMFQYLRDAPKGHISHCVIQRFDRFDRHTDEAAPYKLELRKLGIQLRSATQATDDTPSGRLMVTMLSGFAQFDNEVKGERSVSGMKARLSSGRWMWCPPTGYLKGSKDGLSLVTDPKLGPLVQRLFERVSEGEERASVLKALTAEGLRSRRGGKLSQQSIKGMLNSRAYVGDAVSRKWGMEAKGDFTGLVSQEIFDRVQLVLAGKSPVAVPHSRNREEFPLRGLLLCSKCLKPVTASTSTGEYHTKHRYFRCHHVAGHLNVKAELVEDAFLALLDQLAPNPARMPFLEAVFRKVWEVKTQGAAADGDALRRELGKLVARKKRMLAQLADGNVSGDDYAELDRETSCSLADIRQRLELLEMEDLDIDAAIAYLSHLLWNARNIWESSDLQGKQRLQRLIFPKGLVIDKAGFGTPVTNSIFILLAGLLGEVSTTEEEMVRPRRFELLTYSFGGCRSIQLSYGRTERA
jgi:site-specific DNA recombinase